MTQCSVNACERTNLCRGLCSAHYQRWKKYGDAEYPRQKPPGRPRGSMKFETGQYVTAHSRVRRTWGSASQYRCFKCGAAAQEWSYDHTDPSEEREETYGPYSRYPEFYAPACHTCHTEIDTTIRRVRKD